MAPVIEDTRQQPTQAQLRLLRSHLPYSLPVLRRLQVAAGAFDSVSPGKVAGAGTSPYAHILFAYDGDGVEGGDSASRPFAAAYLDLSKAPETAAFIYASDQDTTDEDSTKSNAPLYPVDPPLADEWPVHRGEELIAAWSSERRARCRRLVLALLQHIHATAKQEAAEILPLLAARQLSPSPDVVAKAAEAADGFLAKLKINIHDGILHLLHRPEAIATASSPIPPEGLTPVTNVKWPYDKWLFRFENVPVLSDLADHELVVTLAPREGEAAGSSSTLVWDCVHTPEDLALVTSRTYVPRMNDTLLSVPSVALREKESGALQAWAFLGIDGSLWTLHTEPAYRGIGLAKTLVSRLFRQYCGVFDAVVGGGDGAVNQGDGWIMADVSSDNRQSQGVCRRLGAKRTWATSW